MIPGLVSAQQSGRGSLWTMNLAVEVNAEETPAWEKDNAYLLISPSSFECPLSNVFLPIGNIHCVISYLGFDVKSKRSFNILYFFITFSVCFVCFNSFVLCPLFMSYILCFM